MQTKSSPLLRRSWKERRKVTSSQSSSDIHQGGVLGDGEGGRSGEKEEIGYLMSLSMMARLRTIVPFICILLLFACAKTQVKVYPEKPPPQKAPPQQPSPAEPSAKTPPALPAPKTTPPEPPAVKASPRTYSEVVSEWKSYQDLVKWLEKDFSFDAGRYKKFEGTLPSPRTPEETFQLRSGIYIDSALFAKETLNRIDPSYKAQIVVIIMRPYGFNHYVCSFKKDGKLFILDYGTPYRETTGLHGPYQSLAEYRKFYEARNPTGRHIEAITYLP